MKILLIFIINLVMVFLIGCGPQSQILILKNSPIMGVENQTSDSVRSAIIAGCHLAQWKVQELKPGHLLARYEDDELMAEVDILYRTNSYDILYRTSRNLNKHDNLIHPRYNRWIIRLDKSIRKSILRLR